MTGGAGLVVVGSGPGGLEAVRAFRELDAETPVTLVSADPDPPYNRPPLTKDYLRGEAGLDDLWLAEAGWFADHAVELRLGVEVTGLDRAARELMLADGATLAYASLVLATGSRPRPLPVPGGDDPGLIYVRDRASGDRLRALAERPPGRVVVIGSGFIGCEVAANLAAAGGDVVLVTNEDVPHASRLGPEAGERIAGWLSGGGVELRTGSGVGAVRRGSGADWSVELQDGSVVTAAAVVCGGGAAPNVELGEQAGLAVESGGLVTDASLRTSDPHVFAVGDIAYALNEAAGRRLRVEHWGDAEAHGTIAGTVAAGGDAVWGAAPGFWSELGERTLKYTAWEPEHDDRLFVGGDDAWAVWYRSGTALAGVLTYHDDAAYERGQELLERNASFAEAVG